ncbi:EF2KT-like protein [Mya arenaria]|uniref:EF2KT-like protein n=1 Tax=Mya arenaria TaxID=6604 RepID=A0ABY7DRF5_MYAAR|nr:EF2KT-like protein [Mya arenaria]
MATSRQNPRQIDGREETMFSSIASQFFQMVPIRRIQWQLLMFCDREPVTIDKSITLSFLSADVQKEELGVDQQRILLSLTVRSQLCQSYPPSTQYQRVFVKKLLSLLEEYDVEICDDLYEVYTDLLQQHDTEEDALCYKTFSLGEEESVTVVESVNMISFGTTGLSTWQACGVSSYAFTDNSSHVLNLVAHNVHQNLSRHISGPYTSHNRIKSGQSGPVKQVRHSSEDDVHHVSACGGETDHTECDRTRQGCRNNSDVDGVDDCENMSTSVTSISDLQDGDDGALNLNRKYWKEIGHDIFAYDATRTVSVGKLDWEATRDQLEEPYRDIDMVLAADVVYDVRVIPALVHVLKTFLTPSDGRSPCVAYIASTIRNEDTRDQFLIALSAEGLCYTPCESPSRQLFHYDNSVPIEIIKVTA